MAGAGKGRSLITNKKARSFFFMLLSFMIILGINSVLPLIEGEAHYTVETVEVTYAEYKVMKAQNVNYSLTYLTNIRMDEYIEEYIVKNNLTQEQTVSVDVPDNFKVKVHTKFFFEYPFWYIATATSLLSAVLLFYSLFNYLLTVGKDTVKKYVDLQKDLDVMSNDSLDPVTFEPWMDNVFNYRRKVKQHIGNIKYRIDKLEHKTKYKHKHRLKRYFLATTPEVMQAQLLKLGELSKKEKKYFNKREHLTTLLEDAYIKTYVANGRVKYFRYIHPMFVYNGVNILGRTVDSYSMINSDSKKIMNDAGAKIIFSLSITLIFSTLFTVTAISSVGQSPLWIFINIMAKLAPLLIQIPLAFDYNNSFMEKHLIKNLIERKSIGLQYMADMREKVSVEPVLPPEVVHTVKKEVEPHASEDITGSRHEDPRGLEPGNA